MSQPVLNSEISIRHKSNKQLHTGLTSAQGQRNAANFQRNQIFSGLYTLTQVFRLHNR